MVDESPAGSIEYDPDARILHVVGFDEQAPATPEALCEADRAAGWDIVTPLSGVPGFEIRASLWIGDDAGASTFFQLGGAQCPGENLVIEGDIWVRSSADSAGPRASRPVNRLTSGAPGLAEARSVIGIRCTEPEQYGLIVGTAREQRGELLLYHTDVTAVDQPLRGGMSSKGAGGWYGSRFEIVGCRISGIASRAVYGPGTRNAVLRDTLFEDCDIVFSLGDRVAARCVFRGNVLPLDRAVGTYIDCRLEDNERDLVWPARGTIFWIDTGEGVAGPPPERARVRDVQAAEFPEGPPVLMEYRRVVFEVGGDDGRPVPGARLRIAASPADDHAVQAVPPILTDERGCTPEDLYQDAILLARARWHRLEEGGGIVRVPYRYRIRIEDRQGRRMFLERDDKDLGRPGSWRVTFSPEPAK